MTCSGSSSGNQMFLLPKYNQLEYLSALESQWELQLWWFSLCTIISCKKTLFGLKTCTESQGFSYSSSGLSSQNIWVVEVILLLLSMQGIQEGIQWVICQCKLPIVGLLCFEISTKMWKYLYHRICHSVTAYGFKEMWVFLTVDLSVTEHCHISRL